MRFDYADDDYLQIAHKAYMEWHQSPKYKGIFYPVPYILTGAGNPYGESWIAKTTKALTNRELPWTKLEDAAAAKRKYPVLSGHLATPKFSGYYNEDAGWADASSEMTVLSWAFPSSAAAPAPSRGLRLTQTARSKGSRPSVDP